MAGGNNDCNHIRLKALSAVLPKKRESVRLGPEMKIRQLDNQTLRRERQTVRLEGQTVSKAERQTVRCER